MQGNFFAALKLWRFMKRNNDPMHTVHIQQLIQLQHNAKDDAAFIISLDKSTFKYADVINPCLSDVNILWACPTPLCGDGVEQYNPCFIMAVLSVTPLSNNLELLNQAQLPEVLFTTHSDIRRSMMLNSMRMSDEFVESGIERIFEITKQRLTKNQTDVVHDHLAYLMHAILGARREYAQEALLRAESIAAYLGISHAKVLLLLNQYGDDVDGLTASLEGGYAGTLQRKLNIAALIRNQMELLKPFKHRADERETSIINFIAKVVEMWKDY